MRTISIRYHGNPIVKWAANLTFGRAILYFAIGPAIAIPVFYVGSVATLLVTGWNAWDSMAAWSVFMFAVAFGGPLRRRALRIQARRRSAYRN